MTQLQKDLLFELRDILKYISADDLQEILCNVIDYHYFEDKFTIDLLNKIKVIININPDDSDLYNQVWLKPFKKVYLKHRDNDKPAVINDDCKVWCKNGRLHRDDNPAYVRTSGYQAWYKNNKLHNINGPAVLYPDNGIEYWINGKIKGWIYFNHSNF